jgi:hypothetical protein
LIQEKSYQTKIDNLESKFGRRDELKCAIEHTLQRAANVEEEYAELYRLPKSMSDLRLLAFNYEHQYPSFPCLYILYEIDFKKEQALLLDIVGEFYPP